MAERKNQTRTTQRVAGVLAGPTRVTSSERHLDNRERMRHEQRSFRDLGAQEAIGDAFQPEHDALMEEIDVFVVR